MRNLLFVLLASMLTACYAVMPIANDRELDTQQVIVYYDVTHDTKALESFIAKQQIEVLYHYANIHGYALKLKSKKQRKALEQIDGVLSVQDDRMVELQ